MRQWRIDERLEDIVIITVGARNAPTASRVSQRDSGDTEPYATQAHRQAPENASIGSIAYDHNDGHNTPLQSSQCPEQRPVCTPSADEPTVYVCDTKCSDGELRCDGNTPQIC